MSSNDWFFEFTVLGSCLIGLLVSFGSYLIVYVSEFDYLGTSERVWIMSIRTERTIKWVCLDLYLWMIVGFKHIRYDKVKLVFVKSDV
jgi:hypothetical protein